MNRIIIFNGRECSSLDEMPPDVRRLYDEMLASLTAPDKESGPEPGVRIRTRVVVNSKEYPGVAEMPPAIRTAFEKLVTPNNTAALTEKAAEMQRSPVPPETGTPSSLDSQLRLSPSSRLLLSLFVVTALAALLLWR